MAPSFPFSAIVGQEEMKTALLVAAIDETVGGVLVFGDRGTGKSTAVRALASLLPKMRVVADCPYNDDPDNDGSMCAEGCPAEHHKAQKRARNVPVPVVDLPLGATEDRVVGALDLELALTAGKKSFEPGLLAKANRGFLYVDEVNLLEDHLVDLLLDVAASGQNVVEREGLSVKHPARFVLIGSGNPEEGELRPQLLDRFGLSVEIETPRDLDDRVEVVRRRSEFEADPDAFLAKWKRRDGRVRAKIVKARKQLPSVKISNSALESMVNLCLALGTDGLRGELTLSRASRALAAWEGAEEVDISHIRKMAPSALRHRLRRNPLDEAGSTVRVERAISEVLH